MKKQTSNVERPTSNIQFRFRARPSLLGRWASDVGRWTLIATALTGFAAAEDWKLPDEKPAFKTAPGAELVMANCIICHSHEYITTQPAFTRDQWKASVAKMQAKYGAPLAPENVDAVLDYLAKAYGKAAK